MSDRISHKIHGGYVALPFDVDNSITYDERAPRALVGKAVKLVGDRRVGLATDGSTVLGCIVFVDHPDSVGIKVTVQICGVLPFKNPDGAPAVAVNGDGVVGGANGGVKSGASAAKQLGTVTSLEDGWVLVRV